MNELTYVPGPGEDRLDAGLFAPRSMVSSLQSAGRAALSPEAEQLRKVIEKSALAPFFQMRGPEQKSWDQLAELPFCQKLSKPTEREIEFGSVVYWAARDLDKGHQPAAPYVRKWFPKKEIIDAKANKILVALNALPEPQRTEVKERCFQHDKGSEKEQIKAALNNFCEVLVEELKSQERER